MNRLTKTAMIAMIGCFVLEANAVDLPFYVYKDGKGSKEDRFCPSGFMGDYGAIRMDLGYKDNPKQGAACVKFAYSAQATQGKKWAGVYWQNPPNNWGTADGGYDLTGAKKLHFCARGDKGGEIIEFKVGGINGTAFSDSDGAGSGPITLTKEWKDYEIDLTGCDLSYIMGGFCWAANSDDNPEGFVFFLDDIAFVQ